MIDYKKYRAKLKRRLTDGQARFVLAMADNGLRIFAATRELGICDSGGQYYRRVIKEHTGLDVRDFWDMTKLIEMAMQVLVGDQADPAEAKAQ